MGGRGTFAIGNNVAFTYETIGNVEGVKVLKGIDGKHGLPESSHSSESYMKLYPDGTFHEIRFYDKEHSLYLEIAYHTEKSLGQGKILHYHTYDSRFSKNTSGEFSRSKAIKITKDMDIYKKYKKYFKGVKL